MLQMLVLESALEQEQAMHGVTKAQLAALREDNQRLRHQLHAIRRHAVVAGQPATSVFVVTSIHRVGEVTSQTMATLRSPFCGYNMAQRVELMGEDFSRYLYNIQ